MRPGSLAPSQRPPPSVPPPPPASPGLSLPLRHPRTRLSRTLPWRSKRAFKRATGETRRRRARQTPIATQIAALRDATASPVRRLGLGSARRAGRPKGAPARGDKTRHGGAAPRGATSRRGRASLPNDDEDASAARRLRAAPSPKAWGERRDPLDRPTWPRAAPEKAARSPRAAARSLRSLGASPRLAGADSPLPPLRASVPRQRAGRSRVARPGAAEVEPRGVPCARRGVLVTRRFGRFVCQCAPRARDRRKRGRASFPAPRLRDARRRTARGALVEDSSHGPRGSRGERAAMRDEDEDNEPFLGFLFGNVDEDDRVDADYLDEARRAQGSRPGARRPRAFGGASGEKGRRGGWEERRGGEGRR